MYVFGSVRQLFLCLRHFKWALIMALKLFVCICIYIGFKSFSIYLHADTFTIANYRVIQFNMGYWKSYDRKVLYSIFFFLNFCKISYIFADWYGWLNIYGISPKSGRCQAHGPIFITKILNNSNWRKNGGFSKKKTIKKFLKLN